jgi:hypothetical protein
MTRDMCMMHISLVILILACLREGYGELFDIRQPDQLQWAHDDHNIRGALHRLLEDNQPVAQPAEVCTAYNTALTGIMTCTCERFGSTDVKIFCTDIAETCVSDGSSCYLRTIETVITSTSLSRVTTSCTNSTTAPDLYTCVQIFPITPGSYAGIEKCTATLNGDVCSSCSECANARNATTNTTSISVNCCNVKEDAIQSCAPVGPLGSFLSVYDAIPAGSEGTCPSGATEQLSRSWVGFLLVTLSAMWIVIR